MSSTHNTNMALRQQKQNTERKPTYGEVKIARLDELDYSQKVDNIVDSLYDKPLPKKLPKEEASQYYTEKLQQCFNAPQHTDKEKTPEVKPKVISLEICLYSHSLAL